jgi:hypothetical protein
MPGMKPGMTDERQSLSTSWPGSSRPSTFGSLLSGEDVDARDIGVRKHAVLWTAMRGHDE